VNQAAKWFHMTAGKNNIPLVIRMIIGRGWGQGAQHSQSLESWFAHIPGLKVVMPATPYDAKGLLISAVEDNNPVIFMEHRWLHNTFGEVPEEKYKVPIGEAKVINKGSDITIVSHSYMSIEALKSAKILKKHNVSCEIVDLRSLRPLDVNTIITSVKKTKRLLVVDNGWTKFGVSAEIISSITEKIFSDLKSAPKRIGIEDVPIPSTRALAIHSYPTPSKIINAVSDLIGVEINLTEEEKKQDPLDIPDQNFTGPF
ncbi:MAG: alpha-ketoacid dehydrogenase subunit beta, partial [Gammaproteobacteria bacterium]|nr:alpha-ketoacid dehydrogenase subunit beta [Gammaproteobacteria bacterium]